MQTDRKNRRRLSRLATLLAGLTVVLSAVAAPLLTISPAYASSGQLYLSPGSGNITQNATFTVAVRVNTGGEAINAVQANFSYPANLLQFMSIGGEGSAFTVAAPSNGGNGAVSIARAEFGGVTGDALVATVTFKAIAGSGSAAMAFTAGSEADRTSDSKNVVTSTNGATFTLKSGATVTPPAPNTSNASSTKTPQPGPAPAPTTPPAAPTPTSTSTPEATTPEPAAAAPTPSPATTTGSVNTNVDGKAASSNGTMWRISGLLIIAIAGVVGTTYFRRRHSSLLAAPAGAGANSGAPTGNSGTAPLSASFRYGPPTSQVNRFTGSATPTITPTVHTPAATDTSAPTKTSPTPATTDVPALPVKPQEPSMAVKTPALVVKPLSEQTPPQTPASKPEPSAQPASATKTPVQQPAIEATPLAAAPTPTPLPTAATETKPAIEPAKPVMPSLVEPTKEIIGQDLTAESATAQGYTQPEPVVIRPTAPVGDVNKPAKSTL